MENYEEKYKQTLKRAKEMLSISTDTSQLTAKETVEFIFPELLESEDERIRKELIRDIDIAMPIETAQKYISWLEKQGEKKPVSKVKSKFRIGDVIEVKPMKCQGKIFTSKPNKIIDITEESYILDDGKSYSIELQDGWKLSEQKPAWSEYDQIQLDEAIKMVESNGTWVRSSDAVKKVSDWLKSLKDRVQPQQKSSWSEEDEKHVRSITHTINCCKAQFPSSAIVYNSDLNWFESLKERVQQQPKQEWSEEDEKMYQSIIDDTVQENQLDNNQIAWLKSLKPQQKQDWSKKDEDVWRTLLFNFEDMNQKCLWGGEENCYVIDIVNFLKSLKPQTHWKPSEEQMEALSLAVHDSHGHTYYKSLFSLENDLKKL